MKRALWKRSEIGVVSMMTMACLLAWVAAPAHAQNKVVVIPLVENTGGPPAPVPKTGQTASYATQDDGDLEKGVVAPIPRFTDHGNGTVTDRLTGLIWLKEGNCTQFWDGDATGSNDRSWDNAIIAANHLRSNFCGLSDGFQAGDWRLPNQKELYSLIDLGRHHPALPPDCPLAASTVASGYCSSTTGAGGPEVAWDVDFYYGYDYSSSVSPTAATFARFGADSDGALGRWVICEIL